MAISFKVENVPISAVRDRAMFNTFANNQSYVIKDIGSELEVLSSSQSFIVQLGTGEAVICGGSMLSEGDENRITLGENESGYLVIRIDLSQTGTNICRFMNVPSLIQGNINNGSDLIYDLPLYVYATDSSGVQNLNDIRTIKDSTSIADTTYDPLSTNAQSGIAVKQALSNATFSQSQIANLTTDLSNKLGKTETAVSATKWTTYEQDFATNNTNDTWVLVLNGSKVQHRVLPKFGSSTATYLRNDGTFATPPGLMALNNSDVIASGTKIATPYTATKDCYAYVKMQGYSSNKYTFFIDGAEVFENGSADSGITTLLIFLRKGQKLTWTNSTSNWSDGLKMYKIYGTK